MDISHSLVFISLPRLSYLSQINKKIKNKKKMWHIYTIEYYSDIRKHKIPPLATTWIYLENIMLSEASQTKKARTI